MLELSADRFACSASVNNAKRLVYLKLMEKYQNTELAELIPGARLVTTDDGHLLLVTSAKQCAELVSEFLKER